MKTIRYLIAVLLCSLALIASCSKKPSQEEYDRGALIFVSTPPGAAIWLDGGNTELTTPDYLGGVTTGQHHVTLVLSGYQEWSQDILVEKGETTNVNAHLDIIPTILVITSRPPGAGIWINGNPTGRVTPDTVADIASEQYAVRLLRANCFPWDSTFQATPAQTINVRATLAPAPSYKLAYNKVDSLFVADLDGLDPVLFADNYFSFEENQASFGDAGIILWSPTGEYLAYASDTGTTIFHRDGHLIRELPFGSPDMFDQKLAADFNWSRSGQQLVNQTWISPGVGIYDIPTGELNVIYRFTYGNSPLFSPDGTLIYFVGNAMGWSRIHVVNVNDGHERSITDLFTSNGDMGLDLSWISETEILFKNDGIASESQGLFVVNTVVAKDSFSIPIRVVTDRIEQLRVSHDKRLFAYVTESGIYYGTIGNWTPVFLHGCLDPDFNSIAWSPDDNALAYRTIGGVYWIYLNGRTFHIIDQPLLYPYYYNRGSISVTQ